MNKGNSQQAAPAGEVGGHISYAQNGQTVATSDGKKGGYFEGRRHSEGGIKGVNVDTGQPIEVETDEIIITRNAVLDDTKREFEGEMLTNKEILSRINQSGGGVAFAAGGSVPACIPCSGKRYKFGGQTTTDYNVVKRAGGTFAPASGYLEAREIAVSDLLEENRDGQRLSEAIKNHKEGRGSQSEGKILVREHSGRYEIADGFHRAAKAICEGRATIKANVLRGEEVYRRALSAGSEHNDALLDFEREITGSDYTLRRVPVADVLESDPDAKEFALGEAKNLKPGRPVTEPIILGRISRGGPSFAGGVIDGFNRLAQAVANGDQTIPAYTQPSVLYARGGQPGRARRVPADFDTDLGIRFGEKIKGTDYIIVAHSTSSALLPVIQKEGLRIGSARVWDSTSFNKLYFELEPTATHYGQNVYGWKACQQHGGSPVTLYVKVSVKDLHTDKDDADLGERYRRNQKECYKSIPAEHILGARFLSIDIKPEDFAEFAALPVHFEQGGAVSGSKEGARSAFQHLLAAPNEGVSLLLRGREQQTARTGDAFRYHTRGARPAPYSVDVVEYACDSGTRYVGYNDDEVIVAAAFVDSSDELTGVVTAAGYENLGIGTRLVQFIFKKRPTVRPSRHVVSKSGQSLLGRVGLFAAGGAVATEWDLSEMTEDLRTELTRLFPDNFTNVQYSINLHESVQITFAVEPKEKWTNGIFHNSTHLTIYVGAVNKEGRKVQRMKDGHVSIESSRFSAHKFGPLGIKAIRAKKVATVPQAQAYIVKYFADLKLALDGARHFAGDFTRFEKVVRESKSVEDAMVKIRAIKDVDPQTSEAFRNKYDPEHKLTPLQTLEKFYNEVKGITPKPATKDSDEAYNARRLKSMRGMFWKFGKNGGIYTIKDISNKDYTFGNISAKDEVLTVSEKTFESEFIDVTAEVRQRAAGIQGGSYQGNFEVTQYEDNVFTLRSGQDTYNVIVGPGFDLDTMMVSRLSTGAQVSDKALAKYVGAYTLRYLMQQAIQDHVNEHNPESKQREIQRFINTNPNAVKEPEPLMRLVNKEEGTEVRVIEADNGLFRVLMKDLDSGEMLPFAKAFPDFKDAEKQAREWATPGSNKDPRFIFTGKRQGSEAYVLFESMRDALDVLEQSGLHARYRVEWLQGYDLPIGATEEGLYGLSFSTGNPLTRGVLEASLAVQKQEAAAAAAASAPPANGFTDVEVINAAWRKLKEKLGERKAGKYFEQVDRLINPNQHTVVDYRENGVVTREGDHYTFHALGDMDLKTWRIAWKKDATDQFKQPAVPALPKQHIGSHEPTNPEPKMVWDLAEQIKGGKDEYTGRVASNAGMGNVMKIARELDIPAGDVRLIYIGNSEWAVFKRAGSVGGYREEGMLPGGEKGVQAEKWVVIVEDNVAGKNQEISREEFLIDATGKDRIQHAKVPAIRALLKMAKAAPQFANTSLVYVDERGRKEEKLRLQTGSVLFRVNVDKKGTEDELDVFDEAEFLEAHGLLGLRTDCWIRNSSMVPESVKDEVGNTPEPKRRFELPLGPATDTKNLPHLGKNVFYRDGLRPHLEALHFFDGFVALTNGNTLAFYPQKGFKKGCYTDKLEKVDDKHVPSAWNKYDSTHAVFSVMPLDGEVEGSINMFNLFYYLTFLHIAVPKNCVRWVRFYMETKQGYMPISFDMDLLLHQVVVKFIQAGKGGNVYFRASRPNRGVLFSEKKIATTQYNQEKEYYKAAASTMMILAMPVLNFDTDYDQYVKTPDGYAYQDVNHHIAIGLNYNLSSGEITDEKGKKDDFIWSKNSLLSASDFALTRKDLKEAPDTVVKLWDYYRDIFENTAEITTQHQKIWNAMQWVRLFTIKK